MHERLGATEVLDLGTSVTDVHYRLTKLSIVYCLLSGSETALTKMVRHNYYYY